ncbi:phage gp6-like head-tail connector protein [Alkalihalobacillus sp. NPDC078783]
MNKVTDEILEQFKGRMHITSKAEDGNLKSMLASSYFYVQDKCGDFDLTVDGTGKELVFERSRYIYNDALEYFEDNFKSMIIGFQMSQLPEVPDEEE